ncbi:hypothetical protein GALMADRAFT_1294976 [Galerina marginata CBS 339.88]|uniref:Alpha-type protein kinase domain-containing protein n=1 Tax=Galerina marginata (strain CBS 339.88) TaxID=685588 RepID=A0A067TDL0_GALM3|nr:hypothetical protein GALMADRAFT_1294976 [Galerina marginata CBS 339.88]
MLSESFVCGGPQNIYNGCQEVFPRLPAPVDKVCSKCSKLNAPSLSDIDRDHILKYKQCMSCGVCGRTVSNPCGTCRRYDLEASGLTDPARDAAAEERRNRAQRSFGTSVARETATTPTPSLAVPQTMGATTSVAELESARLSSTKNTWTIIYNVRRSSKGPIDKTLGSGTLPFDGETTMPVVLEELVKQINPSWTRIEGHTLDLYASECELRHAENYNFAQEAQTLTIKGFYNFYLQRPDKHLVLPDPKKAKLPRGTFLSLELFIHDNKYKDRIQQNNPQFSSDDEDYAGKGKGKSAKRTRSNRLSVSSDTATIKRKRSGTNSGPLVSMFESDKAISWNRKAVQPVPQVYPIKFTLLTCTVNPTTGHPNLEETFETTGGLLDKKPMDLSSKDKGRSKDVFELSIPSMDGKYVAKAFNASIAKKEGGNRNQVYLLHELVRVKRLASFFEAFVEYADNLAVELAEFSVSEAFIICLDPPIDGIPDAYLVEPRRVSTSVTKFSGTLGSSTRTDKLSGTISAFAHYVAMSSACKLVFADLQGSMHYNPGEPQILVLFDPMTHSPFQTTGLGDFGATGIEDFIDHHVCSIVCDRLGLPSKDVLRQTLAVRIQEVDDAKEAGDDHEEPLTIHKAADPGFMHIEPDASTVPTGGDGWQTNAEAGPSKPQEQLNSKSQLNLTPYDTDSEVGSPTKEGHV